MRIGHRRSYDGDTYLPRVAGDAALTLLDLDARREVRAKRGIILVEQERMVVRAAICGYVLVCP